eukprot:1158987-Pelagomonas_calceolata.AAC.4
MASLPGKPLRRLPTKLSILSECHEVAFQVCTAKIKHAISEHFRIRRVSNLRKSLCNMLKPVRHVQYNLPQDHLDLTFDEVLALNSFVVEAHGSFEPIHDPNIRRAMLFVHKFTHQQTTPASPASNSTSPPLPPLEAVLQTQHKHLKHTVPHQSTKAPTEKKIVKLPALANKEIFNGKSTTSPKAQVLTDPATGKIETDPCTIVAIVEKF